MSVGDAIAWAIEAGSTGMRADMLGWAITAQVVWWGVRAFFAED